MLFFFFFDTALQKTTMKCLSSNTQSLLKIHPFQETIEQYGTITLCHNILDVLFSNGPSLPSPVFSTMHHSIKLSFPEAIFIYFLALGLFRFLLGIIH